MAQLTNETSFEGQYVYNRTILEVNLISEKKKFLLLNTKIGFKWAKLADHIF